MQPATSALENLGVLPQRLEVVDAGDQRTVFLNGYAAARYGCDDKVAERVLLTQLAEVVPLPDRKPAPPTETGSDAKPSQTLADSAKTPPSKAKATR